MLPRDERPHVGAWFEAGQHLELAQTLANLGQQPIGDVANGYQNRDRHAALPGRAVGRAHRRIGGEVEVGVWQDDHVVLGAAERLHALAVPRSRLVDVPRDWRRSHEADRLDARVRKDRLDGCPVAMHDAETPGGSPASASSCAQNMAADGSFSDGLRMKALPQAMASGYIHIGTIAGKLNGVMPATTPSGWRRE